MKPVTLNEFYKETSSSLREDMTADVGHFDVFRVRDLNRGNTAGLAMPYNRKTFYKITLIDGKTEIKFADKTIETGNKTLLFTTPKTPYQYRYEANKNGGYFCIFSADFLLKNKSGVVIDDLPIYKFNGYPVFNLLKGKVQEVRGLFEKMCSEIDSNYSHRFDLLRAYLIELIHIGQKLMTEDMHMQRQNAPHRLAEMFFALLEQQFPIDLPQHRVHLRMPKDFANKLSVHINHLNKTLKQMTGKTTTALINERILREAKILLRQSDWSISQVAFSLGFAEASHFSKFFKKQTGTAPNHFRV